MIIFATIFLTIMASANLYIYRRLFCQLSYNIKWLSLTIVISLMGGEIYLVLSRAINLLPKSSFTYALSSSAVGITFMLLVVTIIYNLGIVSSRKIPFDHNRRQTIRMIFDLTMVAATLNYLIRGFIEGGRSPAINKRVVRVKDFPDDNFTIVQLSDLHVGHTIRRPLVESVVERVNRLRPDMVVITGDLLDRSAAEVADDLQPLSNIVAPTYFVTGNHEYFRGVEAALILVRQLGITTLTNQHQVIKTKKGAFNLVGINDLIGERFKEYAPDLKAAYQGVDPALPTIVLAHQPKAIKYFKNLRCDLMLSGHTHGGQIYPFGLLVKLDQPYIAGLHQHRPGQQIFVSRGTGHWGPPIRVLAPSEISYLTIRS